MKTAWTTIVLAAVLLALPAAAEESKAGAKDKLEAVVGKGADWLVAQQKDGAWLDQGGKPDVGITGLVVAGLAGAPAAVLAKHQKAVDAGIDYLLKNQQESGAIFERDKIPTLSNYKTSVALMALAAYGQDRVKDAVAKARTYLEGTQFGESHMKVQQDDMNYGGWDYDEKSQKPGADMSNVQFALEALHKAGLPAESEAWKRAQRFLNRCQNRSESNDFSEQLGKQGVKVQNDGGFVYDPFASKAGMIDLPGGGKGLLSYGSMTYAGLKSFIYAHVDKQDPRVQAAYGWLRARWTLDENPGLRTDADPKLGKQGWYYYFHTLSKALAAYGEKTLKDDKGVEHAWANELVAKLASLQQEDGSWVNSEQPRWWEDYRPLATSYVLMALNEARGFVTE